MFPPTHCLTRSMGAVRAPLSTTSSLFRPSESVTKLVRMTRDVVTTAITRQRRGATTASSTTPSSATSTICSLTRPMITGERAGWPGVRCRTSSPGPGELSSECERQRQIIQLDRVTHMLLMMLLHWRNEEPRKSERVTGSVLPKDIREIRRKHRIDICTEYF